MRLTKAKPDLAPNQPGDALKCPQCGSERCGLAAITKTMGPVYRCAECTHTGSEQSFSPTRGVENDPED